MNSDFLPRAKPSKTLNSLTQALLPRSAVRFFDILRELRTGPRAMRCAPPLVDLSMWENDAAVTARRIHASMA